MDEREYPSTTEKAPVERSSAEIRQDIATAKENISLTIEEMGERVYEKLDWRGYVKDSPYWALGAAGGLGYLGSRLFVRRTSPMERLLRPIAEEFRGSVHGLLAGSAGPGMIKETLIGVATMAAVRWIKKGIS